MQSFLKNVFTDFNAKSTAYTSVENPAPSSRIPSCADTVVIGGGILGLSTALELAHAGQSVTVLEARKIGDGPSARSGGQLWPGYECCLSDMKDQFGNDLAVNAWKLTDEALATVHLRAATRTDYCDFRPGVLLASKDVEQAEWINDEIEAFTDSNLHFATYVTAEQIRHQHVNTDLYLNGILFKGDEPGWQYGHVNPLKYTQTIARLAHEKSARLVNDAPVQGVRRLPMADGYVVTTPLGEVRAKNLVLAAGAEFIRPKNVGYDTVPRTFVPVRTVILVTEPITEQLAREMIPGDACFCDAADVAMNYGRLIHQPSGPRPYRLAFGGADALMQVQMALDIQNIEREMHTMFPQLRREGIKIENVWSGKCDLSRNCLPVISNPIEGVFHASGFSGQGMVNTTLYAAAIAERILAKTTGKFEILEQLNSDPYVDNLLLAWLQAAKSVFALL